MRLIPFSLAVAVALVCAVTAGAADHQRLVVSGSSSSLGAGAATTIDLAVPGSASSVVLYVPRGYSATLGQPVGSVLGAASATLELGGAPVELGGSIVAGDGSCATGTHDAVWLLELGSATVPLAVDAVDGGPEGLFASYRIETCPAGQVSVHGLELELRGVFENPGAVGAYVWRAVTTLPGGSVVESRSSVLLPAILELTGRLDRNGRAVLEGRLTAGGKPVAGRGVSLWTGRRAASLERSGRATTGLSGRFRLVRTITQTMVFRATASVPVADVTATGCGAAIAPGGCVDATIGPIEASSHVVRIAVPRLPTLRLGSRGPQVGKLQRELVSLRYLPPGSVNGLFGERTWHAVVAFQGWERMPRDGVVGARTWNRLQHAQAPRPWGGLSRGVQIDRPRQVLLLVSGGRVTRAIHVSTGAGGRTPGGTFSVYRKEILSWSIPFRAWMPYANYFYGGFAMHGYPDVPSYPASHGCVRVPMIEATVVYGFAGVGTRVWIR
jgi:hypothetical protein